MTGGAFDIIVDSARAWNQVGLFFGGFLMLAIGGAIIADFIWWRVTAEQYTGKIIGVLWDSKNYFPVIEYTNKIGTTIQANTKSGSSILSTKYPGRQVKILVKPNDPETARIKGYAWFILGLIFVVPGLAFCSISLTQYEISLYTILIGLGVLSYAGFKLVKIIKPKEERENVNAFKSRKRIEWKEKWEKMQPLSEREIKEHLNKQDKTNAKLIPVMMLLSLALFSGGLYLGNKQYQMEQVGVVAEGTIIRLERVNDPNSEGNGFTYYPVVRFEDEQGHTITFQDRVGSSHPMSKQGDNVTVLYNSQFPNIAMIDRGMLNWLPAIGCAGTGVLLLLVNIQTYRKRSRRVKGDYF